MKILKVSLKNFRAAKVLDIDLHDKMNLFVGVNGAGKSTVLQAITATLVALVRKIHNSKKNGNLIHVSDIHQSENQTIIETSLNYEGKIYSWNIERTRPGEKSFTNENHEKLNELSMMLKNKYKQKESLPVLVYYPVSRTIGKQINFNKPAGLQDEELDIYNDALEGNSNFQNFFSWFRDQDDFINQKKLEEDVCGRSAMQNKFGKEIKTVIRAIEEFAPEFSDLRIHRKKPGVTQMLVNKNGIAFDIEQLSDGEKNIIALVGDIARRLTIANPQSKNPLKKAGIILIDEIDLHLHPKWQRKVAIKLNEVFPNCQFIISSHSPQVISHIKPESIIVLRNTDGKITKHFVNESFGKSSNRILEDIMEESSRPKDIDDKIKSIFNLIQDGNISSAQEKIANLRNSIGDDGDLVKAEVLIKRREIIGK